MGIQDLQKFIETHCPTACVPVDLLKIARSVGVRHSRAAGAHGGGNGGGHHRGPSGANNQAVHNHNNNSSRLCLVVDGECCLDRLYGGFFSDWVCGGQWNRMVQFLAVLIQTIQHNNIELAVFFNGGLESQRMDEWIKEQQNERKKIGQVLKHLEMKGTPPPKVWWIPPVSLTTCLRMALRHLNITVLSSMDDHHQEVIAYCRENSFHGLMAEDAEYAIFDPPRYFSSEQLKLTYKGSLETKEFILDEVAKRLNLHPNRFCIFATLLGNYLLIEDDLADFYATLSADAKNKTSGDSLIQAVCDFVRTLPAVDNLDAIGTQIFGSPTAASGTNVTKISSRIQKFKECVQYYLNGTKEGFLRYRTPNIGRKLDSNQYVPTWSAAPVTPYHLHNDTAKFASETQESEMSSLSAYKEATGGYTVSNNPQIVIDPPNRAQMERSAMGNSTTTIKSEDNAAPADDDTVDQNLIMAAANTNTTGVKNSVQNSTTSPGKGSPTNSVQDGTNSVNVRPAAAVSGGYPYQPQPTVYLPPVPPEVMRTACERHQKALMSPWIYQVLSQGEIKIPVCIEEDVPLELPASAFLYRPIRQMVYAILFNMHHLQFQAKQKMEQISTNTNVAGVGSCDTVPDILVKEWVWTKYNQYRNPDLVKAEALGWPVPTVQRLWFGSTMDDKKRRLRAFLTCMHSDTLLMLNTGYVPQHLLVMCCVLRYILAQSEHRILRRQELNAFLAQAVSPRLMDAQAMQAMQLPVVSSRGAQLATLFMRGVECALFANDACGAPIPWLMCCPWLFFDGKLFHFKLLKVEEAKNLLDLCEGQTDQVLKVERMRQAILKGLKVEFARPPLPVTSAARLPGFAPPPPTAFIPTGAPSWPGPGRGRGAMNAAGRRAVLARGGQLEIAGVVVGSWGPNYGTGLSGRSGMHMAPQITSVGGPRKGKGPYLQKYSGAQGGGSNAGTGGGGGAGFTPVGVNRNFPTYNIRRPPTRIRRPPGNQFQTTRKTRKTKGSGSAPAGGKSNSQQSGGTANSAGSSSTRSSAGRGCTIQAGDRSVPVSQIHEGESNTVTATTSSTVDTTVSTSVPTTDGQFEDAGTDNKSVKPSPTIMKKPSEEVQPLQLDTTTRNGNGTDGASSDNGVSVSKAD